MQFERRKRVTATDEQECSSHLMRFTQEVKKTAGVCKQQSSRRKKKPNKTKAFNCSHVRVKSTVVMVEFVKVDSLFTCRFSKDERCVCMRACCVLAITVVFISGNDNSFSTFCTSLYRF